MASLPTWFWIVYYTFLLAITISAIFSILKGKQKLISILSLILTLTIPIIGLINSIERDINQNEWEHLILSLQLGEHWTIFTIFGHLFIFIWFLWFLKMMFSRHPMNNAN
ncbi:hypothetical protein BACSP_04111 [Bacillus sp. T2.9-1]|uniref:hypothetical protein n=1 Tax=Bacillus sp. T2.9-1 TaxID=3041163 RepID=UPI0024778FD6|nr:hypothetical protein [Bacillus sp. T2.9-1]CAI9395485.1 hypothetical protein BACSP_04111 [Bacillus sp. T2.9-1]